MTEFRIPTIRPDDGLLRIEACGVCASDLPIYREGRPGYELPAILGHEIVGTVEQVGREASLRWGVQEGDRLVLERWIPCGHCDFCYAGKYRFCVQEVDGHQLFYGGAPTALSPSLWGGYAEHLYLHPHSVTYKIPTGMPARRATLFTPLANAISWLSTGNIQVGDTVVIQGPGQEGLAAVIAARGAGASKIIVTGLARDRERLNLAKRLGALATIDVDSEDAVVRVSELTEGKMANVILDVAATDSREPIRIAAAIAAPGATVVLAARHRDMSGDSVSGLTIQKQITWRGVRGRERDAVVKALRILEGDQDDIDSLATDAFSLNELEAAFQHLDDPNVVEAVHISIIP
jgi:threonine dehydrogenase-like Zn-dependent dehydrogenase